MDRRIAGSAGASAPAAEQGFTLVEVMIALAISIAVLFANIYLFNTAHKELARARSITAATNLATSKIADFRARVMDAPPCFSANTTTADASLVNYGFTGNGSPCTTGDINPNYPGLLNESFCSPPSSLKPDLDALSPDPAKEYPFKAAAGPAGTPLCKAPGVVNPRFCNPALDPVGCTVIGRTEPPAADQRQQEQTTVDGVQLALAWDVSYVDLDPANPPAADLVGDLVKIKVDAAWMVDNKDHHVTMTTFTTGKAQ